MTNFNHIVFYIIYIDSYIFHIKCHFGRQKREKNDHKIQKYGITVSQKNAILRQSKITYLKRRP